MHFGNWIASAVATAHTSWLSSELLGLDARRQARTMRLVENGHFIEAVCPICTGKIMEARLPFICDAIDINAFKFGNKPMPCQEAGASKCADGAESTQANDAQIVFSNINGVCSTFHIECLLESILVAYDEFSDLSIQQYKYAKKIRNILLQTSRQYGSDEERKIARWLRNWLSSQDYASRTRLFEILEFMDFETTFFFEDGGRSILDSGLPYCGQQLETGCLDSHQYARLIAIGWFRTHHGAEFSRRYRAGHSIFRMLTPAFLSEIGPAVNLALPSELFNIYSHSFSESCLHTRNYIRSIAMVPDIGFGDNAGQRDGRAVLDVKELILQSQSSNDCAAPLMLIENLIIAHRTSFEDAAAYLRDWFEKSQGIKMVNLQFLLVYLINWNEITLDSAQLRAIGRLVMDEIEKNVRCQKIKDSAECIGVAKSIIHLRLIKQGPLTEKQMKDIVKSANTIAAILSFMEKPSSPSQELIDIFTSYSGANGEASNCIIHMSLMLGMAEDDTDVLFRMMVKNNVGECMLYVYNMFPWEYLTCEKDIFILKWIAPRKKMPAMLLSMLMTRIVFDLSTFLGILSIDGIESHEENIASFILSTGWKISEEVGSCTDVRNLFHSLKKRKFYWCIMYLCERYIEDGGSTEDAYISAKDFFTANNTVKDESDAHAVEEDMPAEPANAEDAPTSNRATGNSSSRLVFSASRSNSSKLGRLFGNRTEGAASKKDTDQLISIIQSNRNFAKKKIDAALRTGANLLVDFRAFAMLPENNRPLLASYCTHFDRFLKLCYDTENNHSSSMHHEISHLLEDAIKRICAFGGFINYVQEKEIAKIFNVLYEKKGRSLICTLMMSLKSPQKENWLKQQIFKTVVQKSHYERSELESMVQTLRFDHKNRLMLLDNNDKVHVDPKALSKQAIEAINRLGRNNILQLLWL